MWGDYSAIEDKVIQSELKEPLICGVITATVGNFRPKPMLKEPSIFGMITAGGESKGTVHFLLVGLL